VREVSGAKDIQVVAHCYGASTFTMAMLAGLAGVRSAVLSQIAAHYVVSSKVKLKSDVRVADLLKGLGVRSLTAVAKKAGGFGARLPIRFIHGERNACYLPASTEKTLEALAEKNGRALYSRRVIPGYGHIDCIFGKNAARDVYPHIVEHLLNT